MVDILREQGDLAAASRSIDGQGGNRHSGGMAYQRFDYFYPGLNRCSEMICPCCEIRLKKVVGLYPDQEKFVHQAPYDVGSIVHTFKQNRLAAQRNAGISQAAACKRGLGRNLIRMVEMSINVKGVKPL